MVTGILGGGSSNSWYDVLLNWPKNQTEETKEKTDTFTTASQTLGPYGKEEPKLSDWTEIGSKIMVPKLQFYFYFVKGKGTLKKNEISNW